jgi:uncharacterized repeat protein (TIGR04076 family)
MTAEEEGWGVYHRPKVPMYKVRVTVIKAHPDCGAEHKVGDTFEISHVKKEGIKGFLCPTAFNQLYPVIFAMRYGAEFPWQKDPDSWVVGCGDVETPVVFEIKRLRDDPWIAAANERKK